MVKEDQQIVHTTHITRDEQEELKSGDVGTVIHIHPDQEAFVAEFSSLDGETQAIATVLPSQARRVTEAELTRSSTMPATV